jgi:hypothetical protein
MVRLVVYGSVAIAGVATFVLAAWNTVQAAGWAP